MNIKFQTTDKVLSSHGGLPCFAELLKRLQLRTHIESCLPELKSGTERSWDKFHNMLLSFAAGADSLDEIERKTQDESFLASCNDNAYVAKSYGDFLRSFAKLDIKRLQYKLVELAYQLRSHVTKQSNSITFDLDSTPNEQHGTKIEGAKVNYKGIFGLDTIKCFDEYGIQYWHGVRPGATYSSNDAPEILHEVFQRMPKTKEFLDLIRYVRADSAFCNSAFFSACFLKQVKFVVAMRDNILDPLLHHVKHWSKPSGKLASPLYDGRECDIAEFKYTHEETGKKLRVVVIRAEKELDENEAPLFKDKGIQYEYFSWVTNIFEHEMDRDDLVLFYRGRGNCENFIREMKINFDLTHYPCLKLDANRAYGLIGAFAYNLMRFIALIDQPDRPQFARALRYRLFHLPVQVVRTGGQVIFRFMQHHYEEVSRIRKLLQKIKFGFA